MVWGLTPYLDLFLFKRRVKARKENLRPSDLASISPFNRKSCNSKPDYLLARSIKNVTYLYDTGAKNSVFAGYLLVKVDEKFIWIPFFLLKGELKPVRRTIRGFIEKLIKIL